VGSPTVPVNARDHAIVSEIIDHLTKIYVHGDLEYCDFRPRMMRTVDWSVEMVVNSGESMSNKPYREPFRAHQLHRHPNQKVCFFQNQLSCLNIPYHRVCACALLFFQNLRRKLNI
jgi:hypothetical protein